MMSSYLNKYDIITSTAEDISKAELALVDKKNTKILQSTHKY